MLPTYGRQRESLQGHKAQESKRSRPELILRDARRDTAFRGGRKPLKRRGKVVRVLLGSARAEREIRKGFSITGKEKSSEE